VTAHPSFDAPLLPRFTEWQLRLAAVIKGCPVVRELLIVEHGVEQVIRSDRPEWVPVFTGLSVKQFQELVGVVVARGGEQAGVGRRWGLSLADRVLLVAAYYRTNLTIRQVALLFGISKSATGRVIDHLAPLLVLAPGVHTAGHPVDGACGRIIVNE